MKKVFIIIPLILLFCKSYSQDIGISHIYAGYGFGNIAAIALELSDEEIAGKFGQAFLGYKVRMFKSKKFSIGIHASYCSAYSKQDNFGYIDVKVFSIYSKFDYHWLLKRNSDLYSGISLGTSYFNVKDYSSGTTLPPSKGNAFGVHFNMIGYRHSYGKLSQFVELGFMNLGFIQAGIAYNL